MSDNVVKFRPIEKKPAPQQPKQPGPPGWLVWVGLVAVAVALTAAQQAGWLGG